MPALQLGNKPLSFFEFWPGWLFYAPIFIYVMWCVFRYRGITLPAAANPTLPLGGFYGESKADILGIIRRYLGDAVAPFIACVNGPATTAASIVAQLDRAGLNFPLVAKPDLGCRGAGVQVVRDGAELQKYLAVFPQNATLILQQLVPYVGEAGVFYVREPHATKGRVTSMTLKYFPSVVGDGVRTLRQLIESDARAGQVAHLYLPRFADKLQTVPAAGVTVPLVFAGNHSKGTIFRDGSAYITPQLTAAFDKLAQQIPEFYFGRFDVRFADFDAFCAGRDFVIIELNGAGAEATHIWDSRISLWQAWATLRRQYKTLWQIGRANLNRGVARLPVQDFWQAYRTAKKETLQYPVTH